MVGDARVLPFRDASVRWIMADPPYGQDYAEELWRLGKRYPTPIVLLRESARVLVPGGRVAFLHHILPIMPTDSKGRPLLKKVHAQGVLTGPGYRIRCLTIAERTSIPAPLFDLDDALSAGEP